MFVSFVGYCVYGKLVNLFWMKVMFGLLGNSWFGLFYLFGYYKVIKVREVQSVDDVVSVYVVFGILSKVLLMQWDECSFFVQDIFEFGQ